MTPECRYGLAREEAEAIDSLCSTRRAQGFAYHVTDPEVLRKIADIVLAHAN